MKNLKVCIELTGLRLSKPRQLQNLQELWDRQGALSRDKAYQALPVPPRRDLLKPCALTSRAEAEKGWGRKDLGYTNVDTGVCACVFWEVADCIAEYVFFYGRSLLGCVCVRVCARERSQHAGTE